MASTVVVKKLISTLLRTYASYSLLCLVASK